MSRNHGTFRDGMAFSPIYSRLTLLWNDHSRAFRESDSVAVRLDANEMGCRERPTHLPNFLSCDCLALGLDRLDCSPRVRWLRVRGMSVVGIAIQLTIGKPHARGLMRCSRVAHQGRRACIRRTMRLAS